MVKDILIGRKFEQETLKECIESPRAEFIAVYGRRRVGKTYLIKQYFKNKFDFYVTGIYGGTKQEEIAHFYKQLNSKSRKAFIATNNWFDAFEDLQKYLSGLKKSKIIIFIDEMPWLDTHNSKFIKALELFWNSWASDCAKLKLIVCGSATTWMTNKLIATKGGLHNRITHKMHIAPFSLGETEQYLTKSGFVWNRYQIAELYMILGGIPFYLSMLKSKLNFADNINALFFVENGEMRGEYDILFNSLFNDSKNYKTVVELLATKKSGITRNELLKQSKIEGGRLSDILKNLESCDFLRHYNAFGMKERDVMYQLTDNFVLFYLSFKSDFFSGNESFWQNFTDSGKHRAWSGYAFEQVCLNHTRQIKNALGISGIRSEICSWSNPNAQIDLLINRNDNVINLCEMKYSLAPYEIKKQYYEKITERRELFRTVAKTNKALHLTFITTYPLAKNQYSGMVQQVITLKDIFQIL